MTLPQASTMTTTLGHVSDNQSFHDKDRVQPPHLSINQREQLLAEIHNVLSPYDFIKLCVTNNLLDLMVRETNRHAAQFISDNSGSLKTHSRCPQMEGHRQGGDVSVLLGLLLLYKPRMSTYRSTDEVFHTPVFWSVMSRDWFPILTSFLHFTDNSRVVFQTTHV